MIAKVVYRCEDCGHIFTDDEAIIHWGSRITFLSDMDACPKCESEDLEEIEECNRYECEINEYIKEKKND